MAHTIHLERRLTHRYVSSHAHMDRWQYVGTARVLPARQVRGPSEDPADLGDFIMHARMPAGQDPKLTARALHDYYARSGCAHEYDCCGCLLRTVSVSRISRRDFVLKLGVGRNY